MCQRISKRGCAGRFAHCSVCLQVPSFHSTWSRNFNRNNLVTYKGPLESLYHKSSSIAQCTPTKNIAPPPPHHHSLSERIIEPAGTCLLLCDQLRVLDCVANCVCTGFFLLPDSVPNCMFFIDARNWDSWNEMLDGFRCQPISKRCHDGDEEDELIRWIKWMRWMRLRLWSDDKVTGWWNI